MLKSTHRASSRRIKTRERESSQVQQHMKQQHQPRENSCHWTSLLARKNLSSLSRSFPIIPRKAIYADLRTYISISTLRGQRKRFLLLYALRWKCRVFIYARRKRNFLFPRERGKTFSNANFQGRVIFSALQRLVIMFIHVRGDFLLSDNYPTFYICALDSLTHSVSRRRALHFEFLKNRPGALQARHVQFSSITQRGKKAPNIHCFPIHLLSSMKKKDERYLSRHLPLKRRFFSRPHHHERHRCKI